MGSFGSIKDHSAEVFHQKDFEDGDNTKEFKDSKSICFKPYKEFTSSKTYKEHKGKKEGTKKKNTITKFSKKKYPRAKNN